jgi:hypothetical protein
LVLVVLDETMAALAALAEAKALQERMVQTAISPAAVTAMGSARRAALAAQQALRFWATAISHGSKPEHAWGRLNEFH